MSRELRTRLIQFKIINRIYWTPSRLFRVGLSESPKCWKCQDMDGSLVHMLWGCPNVQSYWSSIKDKLKGIIGFDIPFCPRLFILGDPSILSNVSPPIAEWIQTALMLGPFYTKETTCANMRQHETNSLNKKKEKTHIVQATVVALGRGRARRNRSGNAVP